MGETSPPPRPTREYRIGERVPMPEEKVEVRPASWADDPRKGPKGLFKNGSR